MDYVKDRNRRTFCLLCSGSPVTTKSMENKRRGQGKSRESDKGNKSLGKIEENEKEKLEEVVEEHEKKERSKGIKRCAIKTVKRNKMYLVRGEI